MNRSLFGFALSICLSLICTAFAVAAPPGEDPGIYLLTHPIGSFVILPLAPHAELALQAAIVTPIATKDPATLNALLASIDIRTALEDTRRARLDLG